MSEIVFSSNAVSTVLRELKENARFGKYVKCFKNLSTIVT